MFALLAPAYYVAPQYAHVRGWTHQLPFYTQVGPGPRASGATPGGQRQLHLNAQRGAAARIVRARERAAVRARARLTSRPGSQEELNKQNEHGDFARQRYSRHLNAVPGNKCVPCAGCIAAPCCSPPRLRAVHVHLRARS